MNSRNSSSVANRNTGFVLFVHLRALFFCFDRALAVINYNKHVLVNLFYLRDPSPWAFVGKSFRMSLHHTEELEQLVHLSGET